MGTEVFWKKSPQRRVSLQSYYNLSVPLSSISKYAHGTSCGFRILQGNWERKDKRTRIKSIRTTNPVKISTRLLLFCSMLSSSQSTHGNCFIVYSPLEGHCKVTARSLQLQRYRTRHSAGDRLFWHRLITDFLACPPCNTDAKYKKLCQIWGFNGGDYEECRLLGCKKSVHTLQETHYISATKPNRLMLCKIWGFHGVDDE
jgi:hypothetical protein